MPPRLFPAPVEILLLCDSAKLAHLIEMILHPSGHFQTILIDQPAPCLPIAGPDVGRALETIACLARGGSVALALTGPGAAAGHLGLRLP